MSRKLSCFQRSIPQLLHPFSQLGNELIIVWCFAPIRTIGGARTIRRHGCIKCVFNGLITFGIECFRNDIKADSLSRRIAFSERGDAR